MSKIFILRVIVLVVLMSLISIPCNAGLTWSGDLTVEENSLDGQLSFDGILHLKMEINNEDKQRGVVLLKYKTPDLSLASYDLATLSVYQAYIDLMLSPNLLLRAGRQKISWGSAFSWNPTNYIGSRKNRAEFMIDNPGVDAVNTEYTWGDLFIVFALKPENNWYESGQAIKIGTQLAGSDLAISAFQRETTRALGLDFAASLGNYTVYSETAWKAGDHRFYINNNLKNERPVDQYYLNGVLGVNRIFGESLTVMLEYYYNQAGWSQQEANDFNSYSGPDKPGLSVIKASTLLADLRQNYLFLMFSKSGFLVDECTVSASVLWNMDDQSFIVMPMLRYNIGQNTYLGFNANLNYGDSSSEFGSLLFRTLVNAQLILSF